MKRRNVDTLREVRLWLRDIILPTTGVIGTILFLYKDNLKEKFSTKKDKSI